MLSMVACWLIYNVDMIRYTMSEVYATPYFVAVIGFLTIFAGFMYNDFSSVGANLFGYRFTGKYMGNMQHFTPDYVIKNVGGAGSSVLRG